MALGNFHCSIIIIIVFNMYFLATLGLSCCTWCLVGALLVFLLGVFKLRLTGSSFGALTLECAGSVTVAQA